MVKSMKIKCWVSNGILSVFHQRYALILQKSHQANPVSPEILDASFPVCWLKTLNLEKQDFSICCKTLLLLNKSQIDLQNKLNSSFQSFWKLPNKASGVLLNLILEKKINVSILSNGNILKVSAHLKKLPRVWK